MSTHPKVYISLITWNSKKFLSFCLESIFNQTYQDFKLIVLDNNSTDGSVDFIKKNYPQIKLIQNDKNKGYVAHNRNIESACLPTRQGIKYVLVMNPDIIMESDCLEKLIKAIDSNEKLASVGPKLKRFKFDDDLKNIVKSDIIDSNGLKIFRSRRVVDGGAGEEDNGQFNTQKEVFGISGALALYRLDVLEKIKLSDGEYFDKDYFAYKEDVDLAWRLQNKGWQAEFVPEAVAYHYRSASGDEKSEGLAVIKNRQTKSKMANYYSYKNHLLTLVKNERAGDFLKNFPFIFFYEFKKFLYILIFEWPTLKSIPKFFQQLPEAWSKRKVILK